MGATEGASGDSDDEYWTNIKVGPGLGGPGLVSKTA